jgi:hypothetical protein
MIITHNTLLSEIKTEFTVQFEGLKLEFFKHSHGYTEASSIKDIRTEDASIEQLNSIISPLTLNWESHMTVAEVERNLEKHLGLHAQVFCKLGRTWIETSKTDDYTLDHQMGRSKESQTATS